MRKYLLFLVLLLSALVYAQYNEPSNKIYKIVKDVPENSPATFWQTLSKKHPQRCAMRKAANKNKPSLMAAVSKLGDCSWIKKEAEMYAIQNDTVSGLINDLYSLTGIKEDFDQVRFYIVYDTEKTLACFLKALVKSILVY